MSIKSESLKIERVLDKFLHLYDNLVSDFEKNFYKLEISKEKLKNSIGQYAQKIENMNPENQLKLGYSILKDKNGKIIKSIDDVDVGEMVVVNLFDGSIEAGVELKKDKKFKS